MMDIQPTGSLIHFSHFPRFGLMLLGVASIWDGLEAVEAVEAVVGEPELDVETEVGLFGGLAVDVAWDAASAVC